MSEDALIANHEMEYFEFIYDKKTEKIYTDRIYKDLTQLKIGIAVEFPGETYIPDEKGIYNGIDELREPCKLLICNMIHETDSDKVITCGIYDI